MNPNYPNYPYDPRQYPQVPQQQVPAANVSFFCFLVLSSVKLLII
jgi:hypothetical protein